MQVANEQPAAPDSLIRQAEETQRQVRELARASRKRFRAQFLAAAAKWAVARVLLEQSIANLGLLLYAVLAVVGMAYVWAFYGRFDIAILDFYGTPDFLLSVASGLGAMVTGAAAVGLTLLILLTAYGLATSHSVYQDSHSLHQEAKDHRRAWRYLVGTVAGGLLAVVMPFLVAGGAGAWAADAMVKNPQPVRVTLRSAPAAEAGALPAAGVTSLPAAGRTILVGTTNRFHFFYECKAQEGDPPLNCENGEGTPFIVGTDNVAAIDYDHNVETGEPPTDVASAIDSLADAVSGLGANGKITIGQVDATLDTKDLAAAVDRLAKATGELTVKVAVEPGEVTLRPVIDPPEMTLRAVVDPPELTVKALFQDVATPPHSHGQGRPFIVVPDGEATPVYVVPFRPLSPLTTQDKGIEIPRRTREWLDEFSRSLGTCDDVRVTVTGYASRRGFGDPRHRSTWSQVADDDVQQTMNCGLANLRALTVVAAMVDSRGQADDRWAVAKRALSRECSDQVECVPGRECTPQKACRGAEDCGAREECCCLLDKAETVRDRLLDLCPSEPREWPYAADGDGRPPVRVHAWARGQDSSWVGDGASRSLSRSVHITLEASSGQLDCAQVQL